MTLHLHGVQHTLIRNINYLTSLSMYGVLIAQAFKFERRTLAGKNCKNYKYTWYNITHVYITLRFDKSTIFK